jgi:site-specific recombinase XerD
LLNRFGGRFSHSSLAGIRERLVAKASAGRPNLQKRHITPHTLRHTTTRHRLQSGVEVNVIRSWLGHASTTTTNGYIEIDLMMKRNALQACEVDHSANPDPIWQWPPDIRAWLESL